MNLKSTNKNICTFFLSFEINCLFLFCNLKQTIKLKISKMKSLQHLLEKAICAHNNVSMFPERRGETTVYEFENYLNEDIKEIEEAAAKYSVDPKDTVDRYAEKFERLFCEWLNAKSNCASSFITGPSNFPVKRAQKANNREHAKYQFIQEWRGRVIKAIIKRWKPAVNELEEAVKNLESRKANHEKMKAANAILRKHKGNETALPELIEAGFSENTAREILRPNSWGNKGFEQFYLTNNLANIKRLEIRVEQLRAKEEKAQSENPINEYEINGVKVLENYEIDRLQILFDGKPSQAVINTLKRNGFKWAPSQSAWQRKLTANAKWAAKQVLTNFENENKKS